MKGPGVRYSYRALVVTRLYIAVAIGTFLLSIVVAVLGAVLVYMGAKDASTTMNIFGATVSTSSVGIAALFIAAITAVVIVRRLFKSAERLQEAPDEIFN
jgi:hypothetical protein